MSKILNFLKFQEGREMKKMPSFFYVFLGVVLCLFSSPSFSSTDSAVEIISSALRAHEVIAEDLQSVGLELQSIEDKTLRSGCSNPPVNLRGEQGDKRLCATGELLDKVDIYYKNTQGRRWEPWDIGSNEIRPSGVREITRLACTDDLEKVLSEEDVEMARVMTMIDGEEMELAICASSSFSEKLTEIYNSL
ncbi:hypothetical protein LG302_02595 [Halomonas organivorans]